MYIHTKTRLCVLVLCNGANTHHYVLAQVHVPERFVLTFVLIYIHTSIPICVLVHSAVSTQEIDWYDLFCTSRKMSARSWPLMHSANGLGGGGAAPAALIATTSSHRDWAT